MKRPTVPRRLELIAPETRKSLQQIPKVRSLDDLLDVALTLPNHHVDGAVGKLAQKHPDASITELIDIATDAYIKKSALFSAGVGAGAAIPGTGTAVGVALTGGELATFAVNTVLYVLTVARLQGIDTSNLQLRKTLVISAVLGEDGAQLVADQLGLGVINWAKTQITSMATPTLKSVNTRLANYANKKLAQKIGQNAVGKLVPFGIGAAIGYLSGRSIAKTTVEGIRAAIGAPRDASATQVLAELDGEMGYCGYGTQLSEHERIGITDGR